MTIALLVIGNGRLDYLHRAVRSAGNHLPEFDHYLMIDDSGNDEVAMELDSVYPDWTIRSHSENWGMARAVQDGFDLVLSTDADYVFWLEEDFVILKPPPLDDAFAMLDNLPHLAQALYQRQPLTPEEIAAGSVAGAMSGHQILRWCFHRHIFSLNPCVIPRRVLEFGWPSGNEAEMTKRLIDRDYWFAVWTEGGQYVEHIGNERGAKWQL